MNENLISTLVHYINTHLPSLTDDYQWQFNQQRLPIEHDLIVGNNLLERNLSLRCALHQKWRNTQDQQVRNDLVRWYIYEWGGIRTNAAARLQSYAENDESELINLGTTGIASWSKALSIRDPELYAIFDARVSFSINAIQIIQNVPNPQRFAHLPTRNTTLQRVMPLMKAKTQQWQRVANRELYTSYNRMLATLRNQANNATFQTIEMLLFANAEILANQVQQIFTDR